MPDGARGDQTVDAGSDLHPCAPRGPEQVDGVADESHVERGLHDRQREHGLARQAIGALVHETLEHFLNDRLARHDFIEIDDRLDIQPRGAAEHFDPR